MELPNTTKRSEPCAAVGDIRVDRYTRRHDPVAGRHNVGNMMSAAASVLVTWTLLACLFTWCCLRDMFGLGGFPSSWDNWQGTRELVIQWNFFYAEVASTLEG
ncbi:unnamed protein product [Urochloa humidicola]